MFERILIPLDGSPLAERALPIAARLARASEGTLVLLRVPIIPIIDRTDLTPGQQYSHQVINEEVSKEMEYLEQVAERNDLAGITVEAHERFGAIAPTILSTAQSCHVDLIVMSSHGYTGFTRWSLGSVAQKVVRHSPVPVLVLREGATLPTQAEDSFPLLSVLVPLDGSELAEAAIQPASQLLAGPATFEQGTLHLLRVVAIPSISGKYRSQSYIDFDVEVRAQANQEAEAYLQALVKRSPVSELLAQNVAVTTEVVVTEDVAHAILLAAEPDRKFEGTEVSREQSIIAMATHGRGGLGRWAFGSKTERVLAACKVPLLIIRPHRVNAKHAQKSWRAAQDGAVEGEELIMVEEMWVES